MRTSSIDHDAHDHALCVARVVGAAERLCAGGAQRLTRHRRRVLEIVAASHAAIGAYDIVDRIAGADGRRPAPIAVYRALDFLIALGLVHRLASLNAYVACSRPAGEHRAQFLICDRCGTIAEMTSDSVKRALDDGAEDVGFRITAPVVELVGRCRGCQ
jgi:Fur family zinc uptake transcriptional regulator